MSEITDALAKALPFPRSPLDLPEGKSGNFELKHAYGDCFDIVSVREMFTTGIPASQAKLDKPIRIHELYENGGLWIADVPIEIRQHQEALEKMMPRGRVLVGGLGLGIMAALLARMPEVERVDVVEIAKDVITLCRPRDPKVHVVHDDIKRFIAQQPRWLWDSAFIDAWTGTNEGTWWEDVFPLRRLIRSRFGQLAVIGCQFWAEDIMLGQVGPRLIGVKDPHWYYRAGLKLPMTMQRAKWFLLNIGSPLWERRYGAIYPDLV